MLLLGIDIGTSFIKATVVDANSQTVLATTHSPEREMVISSVQKGWAEQPPEIWWENTVRAIKKLNSIGTFNPKDIVAIGITYQMHGLVLVDKNKRPLRDSIIWCDSRALEIGERAFEQLGEEVCSSSLLNSPGNFTASKLAWVKANEPGLYNQIEKIMWPGDYISMRLCGQINTTPSALSEGMFWDFKKNEISKEVMNYFGFNFSFIPIVNPIFSIHGTIVPEIAELLSFKKNIPITYKAGDQQNNAFSLNVLDPGEVAINAGTSGVIYAVTDSLFYDRSLRVNSFIHINHNIKRPRIGVLICINGAAIMNSWIKRLCGGNMEYHQMNDLAGTIQPGSEGLFIIPFGNGAERMLRNQIVNANICGLNLNKHNQAHIFRAVQEGIAYAFRYGLDIILSAGLKPNVVRAGNSNLFLSDIFSKSLASIIGIPIELYDTEGSVGAALSAGIGAGIYKSPKEAFGNIKLVRRIEPEDVKWYNKSYKLWKRQLESLLEIK